MRMKGSRSYFGLNRSLDFLVLVAAVVLHKTHGSFNFLQNKRLLNFFLFLLFGT